MPEPQRAPEAIAASPADDPSAGRLTGASAALAAVAADERPPGGGSASAGAAPKLRFTWSTDAQGRIVAVSPSLAAAVGAERAAVLGRRWDELGRAGPLAAGADRVAAALAAGTAWSGLLVLWRSGPGRAAVPVEIAGAPARGAPGTHRGFGLCWIGRPVELPLEPDERPPRPRPSPPSLVAASSARPGPDEAAPARRGAPPAPRSGEPDGPSLEGSLSPAERGALHEIARALGARLEPSEPPDAPREERFPAEAQAPAEPLLPTAAPDAEGAPPPAEGERGGAAALRVAADAVVRLDETGLIVAVDGEAPRLFGRSGEEAVGADLAALIHPDDHRAAFDRLAEARAGARAEAVVRARGGAGAPLLMRTGPGDEPGALVAAFLDVSRFKKAEDESAQARRAAERARDGQVEFLARVSHEIRTPLNAIVGFAELMEGERFGPLGSERYREYVGDIRDSGAHVLSLVNDLLDLAKATAGGGDLRRELVDLNATVRGAVATLGPLAMRERVILRTSLADGVPPAVADERSLLQIVLNVLSNAIRFTGAGGQVIVSTGRGEDGAVALRVRDTGPGMNAAEIEAALTPFRQLTSSRREDGTGLGLPLSKALAEANGGAFALLSEPGSGTLVEVRLPSAVGRGRAAA